MATYVTIGIHADTDIRLAHPQALRIDDALVLFAPGGTAQERLEAIERLVAALDELGTAIAAELVTVEAAAA